MRIRQINTRKVLGESNGSIRRGLLAESVLTVFVAYLLALILTEYLSTTAVASLVNAPINLAENADVALGTGLVAIVLGTLAGLYPAAYSTSFPPAMILKGSFGLGAQAADDADLVPVRRLDRPPCRCGNRIVSCWLTIWGSPAKTYWSPNSADRRLTRRKHSLKS